MCLSINAMPTTSKGRPEGSRAGTSPFALYQVPTLTLFSAAVVFRSVARVRNMAISAVASATASMVLQKIVALFASKFDGSSLKPELVEHASLESNSKDSNISSSNGSYGPPSTQMIKASAGPLIVTCSGIAFGAAVACFFEGDVLVFTEGLQVVFARELGLAEDQSTRPLGFAALPSPLVMFAGKLTGHLFETAAAVVGHCSCEEVGLLHRLRWVRLGLPLPGMAVGGNSFRLSTLKHTLKLADSTP